MSFSVEIAANMRRAEEALQAAKQLFATGLLNDSASRSYYSAFYTVTALLLSKEKQFGSHTGVMRAFGLFFVKSGEVEREFGKGLHWLAELRSVGDYGETRRLKKDEAKLGVQIAKSLIHKARELLES
ncbi:MAG: HEPN domain-containing protein [Cyanobacteria bacterium J06623_5]